ncbi:hypothetical protein [Streptomyces glaucescens]|uniref:Conserved putative membrane protein n=1 Tax=Streptomyces glaucescens TaxID=1907 RepID=A0A089WZW6_STRGA|nr:hypothetical protein [Streptomyces glaucescens]AIR96303.1 Conserved putative membrane protein [Streptomyces glaucescens]
MGSWGTLGPALLSLAGVALGAGGSLFGQYLVSRVGARQLEAQETAAHRAELKDAVLKFLGIASRVEKAALARSDGGRVLAGDELDRLVDDLWLAQAEIDLAAGSEPLRGAAYRYALHLAEAARGERADTSALRAPQAQFMDAAYDDMWPGRRRAAGSSP